MIEKWWARGDGAAVYVNHDMSSRSVGQVVVASYGSPEAQIPEDVPPRELPCGLMPTAWAYRLEAKSRPTVEFAEMRAEWKAAPADPETLQDLRTAADRWAYGYPDRQKLVGEHLALAGGVMYKTGNIVEYERLRTYAEAQERADVLHARGLVPCVVYRPERDGGRPQVCAVCLGTGFQSHACPACGK